MFDVYFESPFLKNIKKKISMLVLPIALNIAVSYNKLSLSLVNVFIALNDSSSLEAQYTILHLHKWGNSAQSSTINITF